MNFLKIANFRKIIDKYIINNTLFDLTGDHFSLIWKKITLLDQTSDYIIFLTRQTTQLFELTKQHNVWENTMLFDITKHQVVWPHKKPGCLTLQNTTLFDLTKWAPCCLTWQNTICFLTWQNTKLFDLTKHHFVWPDKTPCCLTWQNDQHHDVWPHKTKLFILTKLQFDLLEQASLTWPSAKQCIGMDLLTFSWLTMYPALTTRIPWLWRVSRIAWLPWATNWL